MTLHDFLQMQPHERIEYIQEHGLAEAERQELFRVNKVIASLIREDAYRERRSQTFKMKFVMIDNNR